MSRLVYVYCPKCQGNCHNYVREGTKKFLSIRCHDCKITFKVDINDFKGLGVHEHK